jgi:hypothetical protein
MEYSGEEEQITIFLRKSVIILPVSLNIEIVEATHGYLLSIQ